MLRNTRWRYSLLVAGLFTGLTTFFCLELWELDSTWSKILPVAVMFSLLIVTIMFLVDSILAFILPYEHAAFWRWIMRL